MRVRSSTLERSVLPATVKVGPSTANREKGILVMKTIRDVATPDFVRLLKCGEFLPLNPVVITTDTYKCETVNAANLTNPPNNNYPVVGEWGAWPAFPSTFPSSMPGFPAGFGPPDPDESLYELCVNNARANAVADSWDVLTSLAEARETYNMLRYALPNFWKKTTWVANLAYLRFKKRADRRFAARDAIEWFSDNWLLARYGIRPTLYDIADAVAYWRKLSEEPPPWVSGKSRQDDQQSKNDIKNNVLAGVYNTSEWTTVSGEDTYRSKAYLGIDLGPLRGLQIDPVVTAYELVPFSFVLDWVVDVGGWLSTLTPQLRGDFLGTQYSLKRSYSCAKHYYIDPRPEAGTTGQGGHSIVWRTQEQYIRVPFDGGTLPRVNLRFSLNKAVDLLALAKRSRSEVFKLLNKR